MEKLRNILFVLIVIVVGTAIGVLMKNWFQKAFHPEISFDQKSHNFDTLYLQENAEVYFVYKNLGNKALKINSVKAGCGCTIPQWNQNFLKPNGKDSLKVIYNIENKGHFIKEVLVYSNYNSSPHHLEISGFVPFNID